jgi:ATP-dependent Clp endopeptidase proteolytic subunit ClpP
MAEQNKNNRLFISSHIDNAIKSDDISDLVTLPKVVYVNKFTEDAARDFASAIAEANDSNQDVIPVCIDSYGGQVYALLSMVDMLKQCTKPIATIAVGKVMSCGAILFSQGTEGYRYMSPYATLLIHDVSSWDHGKVEEIKAGAEETDRLNKLIYKLMAENTGHPEDYFMNLVHEKCHADWFLTAQEAKRHNLANFIRLPSYKIDVSVSMQFS